MIVGNFLSVISACKGKWSKNFVFILDTAASIHGIGTVYSTRFNVLADFDSDGFQATGINFVDKKRLPYYADGDIVEHNGFYVTNELRTLLDMLILSDMMDYFTIEECLDEIINEYSMEEVVEYFNNKGYLQLLYDSMETVMYSYL